MSAIIIKNIRYVYLSCVTHRAFHSFLHDALPISTQYTSSLANIKDMAEYHQGKVKEISGIEMPDVPNEKTLILHFKELKPAIPNAASSLYGEHAAPYHYFKKLPFEKLVCSDQARKHPLYFRP